jgi:glycosyltransferase involved in cell wall biosynthesis
MKILVLSHSSEIGGAELSMLDFFDHWSSTDKNIQLRFIIKSPGGELEEKLKKRKWIYETIDYSAWMTRKTDIKTYDVLKNIKKNTRAILRIEDTIREYKPDMIMTNTIVAPWAAFAAKLNGLPHVWFVREYGDLDHGHIFEIGRKKTFQDIDTLSELVVTNSQSLTEHVAKYVDKGKIITLYTPFKIDQIRKLAEEKTENPFSKKADIKTVMLGVVKPSKGQEQAIRATAELKKENIQAELTIVGHANPPDYIDDLKKLAKQLKVEDRIYFLGKKTNPYPYINYADVGIMCSRMEAFGRTTFEYLTLGRPVIGFNSGGTKEMVKDGINGFLIENNNVTDLKQKIELYTKNKNILSSHKKAATDSSTAMIKGKNSADKLVIKIRSLSHSNNYSKIPNLTEQWLMSISSSSEDLLVSIQDLTEKNMVLNQKLSDIRNSNSWKWVRKINTMRDKLRKK